MLRKEIWPKNSPSLARRRASAFKASASKLSPLQPASPSPGQQWSACMLVRWSAMTVAAITSDHESDGLQSLGEPPR